MTWISSNASSMVKSRHLKALMPWFMAVQLAIKSRSDSDPIVWLHPFNQRPSSSSESAASGWITAWHFGTANPSPINWSLGAFWRNKRGEVEKSVRRAKKLNGLKQWDTKRGGGSINKKCFFSTSVVWQMTAQLRPAAANSPQLKQRKKKGSERERQTWNETQWQKTTTAVDQTRRM